MVVVVVKIEGRSWFCYSVIVCLSVLSGGIKSNFFVRKKVLKKRREEEEEEKETNKKLILACYCLFPIYYYTSELLFRNKYKLRQIS